MNCPAPSLRPHYRALTATTGMCRIVYRFLASLARLTVRSGRSKDLEIIVLRHQLAVLHRQNNRPALADEDRALLAAVATGLPRPQRAGWLVTPETLLRWHRRRIARHWTQPCQAPGRPRTPHPLRRDSHPPATPSHPNHRRCRPRRSSLRAGPSLIGTYLPPPAVRASSRTEMTLLGADYCRAEM